MFTEMGKPDGHPLKDATIISSCCKFSGLSSEPPDGNHELPSDLSSAIGKLEVHINHDFAKKHNFNKVDVYHYAITPRF